ncbi:hypothetical protein GWK47_032209 [Chionoecetes opilio]|uniref:Regulatory protein zeste n=1 Tax=Chionoecetes opilio TaxID=41210 RepID=A0A8J5CQ70_CHIOP|nr:hypothetical protein GWK47_032209 [Chionoecetes opilio]
MEGTLDRAPPLSQEQRMMFLRLVGEKTILQDRSSNPALIRKKALAWENVRKAFTPMNPDSHRRTVDQLRRCYSRIKQSKFTSVSTPVVVQTQTVEQPHRVTHARSSGASQYGLERSQPRTLLLHTRRIGPSSPCLTNHSCATSLVPWSWCTVYP